MDTYGNIITATARSVIASQELTLNKEVDNYLTESIDKIFFSE